MKFRYLAFAIALSCSLLQLGCTSCVTGMVQGRTAGRPATDKFHSQWNSSDWDAVVKECDPDMFENTPEPKLRKFFSVVHDKLGNNVSAKEGGWRTNATTSGTYYIVEYNTQFEKGPGTEKFTWKIYGNEAKLVAYNVNSNLLLDPSLRDN